MKLKSTFVNFFLFFPLTAVDLIFKELPSPYLTYLNRYFIKLSLYYSRPHLTVLSQLFFKWLHSFKWLFLKNQIHCPTRTPWRNGSASDSRSEGCVFKSRRGHFFLFTVFFFFFFFHACNSPSFLS